MSELKEQYIDENGIAYCDVCGEAIEMMYPPSSFMASRKHARKCKCERE